MKKQENEGVLKHELFLHGIYSGDYKMEDFGITGDESYKDLCQMAKDFVSELQTKRLRNKHEPDWKDDLSEEELDM